MPLTLTDEEIQALKRFMDGFMPALSQDIAHIDRIANRHDLAEVERTLLALRRRM